jgi:hypothetical protein
MHSAPKSSLLRLKSESLNYPTYISLKKVPGVTVNSETLLETTYDNTFLALTRGSIAEADLYLFSMPPTIPNAPEDENIRTTQLSFKCRIDYLHALLAEMKDEFQTAITIYERILARVVIGDQGTQTFWKQTCKHNLARIHALRGDKTKVRKLLQQVLDSLSIEYSLERMHVSRDLMHLLHTTEPDQKRLSTFLQGSAIVSSHQSDLPSTLIRLQSASEYIAAACASRCESFMKKVPWVQLSNDCDQLSTLLSVPITLPHQRTLFEVCLKLSRSLEVTSTSLRLSPERSHAHEAFLLKVDQFKMPFSISMKRPSHAVQKEQLEEDDFSDIQVLDLLPP